jgi:nucleoside-diphosphate-sugar epimerase
MKALVTGSMGFVGRHFWNELPGRRGWSVDVCDIQIGLGAMDFFGQSTTRYDLVVHAAAREPHRAAIDGQPASHIYNQMLDAAMFEWAVRTKQRHVLYFSSCAAADHKPDAYGLLKLTGERMAEQAQACGVPVTVVRPYSGYGEDQDERFPFGAFIARAKRREDPFTIWGDGTQMRDWIHIDDIVRASLTLVEADVPGPVSLCTGEGTAMRDVVELVCKQAGYAPEIELHPERSAGAAYRVGDPTLMHEFHKPTVTLAEGVARALA